MKAILIAAISTLIFETSIMAQTVIPLYDKVPNSKPVRGDERVEQLPGGPRVSHVSIPTITIYQPEKDSTPNTAVIVCPGGGYTRLSMGHEGLDIARELNKWGITVFVLKYRLPDDSLMVDKSIGPLQDVQRAIQLVRQNAVKWNIDPQKLGVMGFSAGGHLASTAATHFNEVVIDNPQKMSLRPDFSILIYPVISFQEGLAHKGSKDHLIGDNPVQALVNKYSNELQVTPQTPPAFLVHAGDDKSVPVGNSLVYYEALLKNKVSAELHIYPKGGHGFGMVNKTTEDKWMDRMRNWMIASGYLKPI